ncbi:GAD-like domain-containing protein [Dentiradicibacter hellwigii]|uniref:GAD-like domain-containing protein n=1 Tax=Dentiradicibacter hellwigii TaxID=3149053 RepID=A0ABV4UEG9_9RHOO
MDEYLEGFLEDWGEPTQRIEADEAVLAQLAPSVPPLLINYWRHLGFSVFKDGLMSLCNPLEWKPLIDEWIKGTELEQLDVFIPVMKGVYGEFELLGIHYGFSPLLMTLDGGFIGDREYPECSLETCIKSLFMIQPDKFFPSTDREDFLDVFHRHAPFGPQEMLGYVPALPLGGSRDYAKLQKVDAFAYLSMLRQITGELKGVMEYADIYK